MSRYPVAPRDRQAYDLKQLLIQQQIREHSAHLYGAENTNEAIQSAQLNINRLARYVRSSRKAKGLSRAQLAQASQLSSDLILAIENELVSIEDLPEGWLNLAKPLGCSEAELNQIASLLQTQSLQADTPSLLAQAWEWGKSKIYEVFSGLNLSPLRLTMVFAFTMLVVLTVTAGALLIYKDSPTVTVARSVPIPQSSLPVLDHPISASSFLTGSGLDTWIYYPDSTMPITGTQIRNDWKFSSSSRIIVVERFRNEENELSQTPPQLGAMWRNENTEASILTTGLISVLSFLCGSALTLALVGARTNKFIDSIRKTRRVRRANQARASFLFK